MREHFSPHSFQISSATETLASGHFELQNGSAAARTGGAVAARGTAGNNRAAGRGTAEISEDLLQDSQFQPLGRGLAGIHVNDATVFKPVLAEACHLVIGIE